MGWDTHISIESINGRICQDVYLLNKTWFMTRNRTDNAQSAEKKEIEWFSLKLFGELQLVNNPLIFHITGSNPNNDSPCLEVEFARFSQPVSFPKDSQIEEYAACIPLEQVCCGISKCLCNN